MKVGITAIATIVLIAGAIAAEAESGPGIVIDNADNKVKFQKFDVGDSWSITLRNASTNAVDYEFSGTIGNEMAGENWFVWFSCVSPGALKNGVAKFVVPGSYNVDVSIEGITASGFIDVTGADLQKEGGCTPIPPVPELAPIVLTSAGLLGLIGLVRMRRKD